MTKYQKLYIVEHGVRLNAQHYVISHYKVFSSEKRAQAHLDSIYKNVLASRPWAERLPEAVKVDFSQDTNYPCTLWTIQRHEMAVDMEG